MKREHSFADGAATFGWGVIVLFVLVGVAGVFSTFSGDQLAAGGIGAVVVIVGLGLGAEHGPRHADGGRINGRRRR